MAHAAKQRDWRQQTKRLQHYLGLDGSHIGATPPAILVCIDVEAFEFDQSKITEVGLSVLDCADIAFVQPGLGGCHWVSKIAARHFRIAEYKHLVNRKHIVGCPDRFMFGQSEMLAGHGLASSLRNYFKTLSTNNRKVVLIGHSVQSDVKYLATLGCDPTTDIHDTIDTCDLQRFACRNHRQQGLVKLLEHYSLPNQYLHNAGNDAYYTLQAAIVIALDTIVNKKSAADWEVEKKIRIDKAIAEAISRTTAEFDGWSSSDDEGDEAEDARVQGPATTQRQHNRNEYSGTVYYHTNSNNPPMHRHLTSDGAGDRRAVPTGQRQSVAASSPMPVLVTDPSRAPKETNPHSANRRGGSAGRGRGRGHRSRGGYGRSSDESRF